MTVPKVGKTWGSRGVSAPTAAARQGPGQFAPGTVGAAMQYEEPKN